MVLVVFGIGCGKKVAVGNSDGKGVGFLSGPSPDLREIEKLHCYGVYLEMDKEDEDHFYDSLSKISDFSLIVEKGNPLLKSKGNEGTVDFSVMIDPKSSMDLIKLQEVTKLYNQLDFNFINYRELICDLNPELLQLADENEKDEDYSRWFFKKKNNKLIDEGCLYAEKKGLLGHKNYRTCNPYWPLVSINYFQEEGKNQYGNQWFLNSIDQEKNRFLKLANESQILGDYEKEQYYLRRRNEMRVDGEGILIGLLDTGYTNHPELPMKQIDQPENFTSGKSAYDQVGKFGFMYGHGTGMASALISHDGRQVEDGKNAGHMKHFVRGVVPKARIRPYRVSKGHVVHFTFNSVIKAIESAILNNRRINDPLSDKNVRILSMSLAGPIPRKKLRDTLRVAINEGIIPVAASGNYIPWFLGKYVMWPAHFDETIAAAASDIDNNPWEASSNGDKVDISAPGLHVFGAKVAKVKNRETFGVERGKGTSYGTVFTVGSIALWLAYHGETALLPYPNKLVLFRYLLDKIFKEGRHTPMRCEKEKWACDDIEEGHFGKGVINVKALIETKLPSVEELDEWSLNHKRSTVGGITNELVRNYFNNLASLLNVSLSHQLVTAFCETFQIREEKLEAFIRLNGQEVFIHFVNDEEFHQLLKEKLLNLKTKNQRKVPIKDEIRGHILKSFSKSFQKRW